MEQCIEILWGLAQARDGLDFNTDSYFLAHIILETLPKDFKMS